AGLLADPPRARISGDPRHDLRLPRHAGADRYERVSPISEPLATARGGSHDELGRELQVHGGPPPALLPARPDGAASPRPPAIATRCRSRTPMELGPARATWGTICRADTDLHLGASRL